MGWVKDALQQLNQGNDVEVMPFGGSMRGRIESGQKVTLSPVKASDVAIDDVVMVRERGSYLLHLVKEIKGSEFLIGNNLGKVNGWVQGDAIVAKVTKVGELITATVEEMLPNCRCKVRTNDGSSHHAIFRKELARVIFRVVPGDVVQLSLAKDGKYHVIGIQ